MISTCPSNTEAPFLALSIPPVIIIYLVSRFSSVSFHIWSHYLFFNFLRVGWMCVFPSLRSRKLSDILAYFYEKLWHHLLHKIKIFTQSK